MFGFWEVLLYWESRFNRDLTFRFIPLIIRFFFFRKVSLREGKAVFASVVIIAGLTVERN